MKFGKLKTIDGVDFTLPDDHPRNAELFRRIAPDNSNSKVYVGATGWSMKEWVGHLYPAKTKTKEYLYHYSRQFNSIELNTTHYRIPTIQTIDNWVEQTPDEFRFCPKILQRISHSKDLGIGSQLLNEFCVQIARLEEKLGCCFMQLPPYFDRDRMPILEAFLRRWPAEMPLAIEFRHVSWFESEACIGQWSELMERHGIATVITDVAGRRDVLHMALTREHTMIRFVGNTLHQTDYKRVDDWVQRLHQWFGAGLKKVYFFPHQPDNLLVPETAVYLAQKMAEYGMTAPSPTLDQSDGQMELF